MLDEQDRRCPSPASRVRSSAKALGLGLVEARGRLVEQQHPGPGGQRPGQLDEAGQAGGQRVGPLRRRRRVEADPVEHARRPPSAGRAERSRVQRPAELGGGEHVLADGERAEHLEPLEGAGDAEPRPLVGLEPG